MSMETEAGSAFFIPTGTAVVYPRSDGVSLGAANCGSVALAYASSIFANQSRVLLDGLHVLSGVAGETVTLADSGNNTVFAVVVPAASAVWQKIIDWVPNGLRYPAGGFGTTVSAGSVMVTYRLTNHIIPTPIFATNSTFRGNTGGVASLQGQFYGQGLSNTGLVVGLGVNGVNNGFPTIVSANNGFGVATGTFSAQMINESRIDLTFAANILTGGVVYDVWVSVDGVTGYKASLIQPS